MDTSFQTMPSINWISNTDNDDAIMRFFKRESEGGYRVVSKYLNETTQRGGGGRARGCVPVHVLSSTQTGSGGKCEKEGIIKNVTPTEQAAEIAKSEVSREQKENKGRSIKGSSGRKKPHSKPIRGSVKASSTKRKSTEELTELEKLFKKGKKK